jgi:hypothetical protein
MLTLLAACAAVGSDPTDGGKDPATADGTSETGSPVQTTPEPEPAPWETAGTGHTGGASTGDTGVPVPGTGFTATVYREVGGTLQAAMGSFDAAGCWIPGSEVGLAAGVGQAVETASGRWFANRDSDFGELNPVTGAYTAIAVPRGIDTGWAMSITVEPVTDEVLLATLSGAGSLVAHDPVAGVSSLRGSLDNADVVAVTVSSDGSALLALEKSYRSEVDTLLTFDPATGALRGEVRLSTPLAQPDPGPYDRDSRRTWGLRHTPLGLVAIVRSTAHPPAETFLLDPSGTVTPIPCP